MPRSRRDTHDASDSGMSSRSSPRSSSSARTRETHVRRALTKRRLRDRVQAVVVAYESGLVLRGLTSEGPGVTA